MTIGISTYAYFWQLSERAAKPLTMVDLVHSAADLGADALQICDQAQIESMTKSELRAIRRAADEHRIVLELGTKGIQPQHLRRYLAIADELEVGLLRTMLTGGPGGDPPRDDAERVLVGILADFERASVTIALETYEQVPTAQLVELVEAVGSPRLGICIDPANTVSILENPRDVVEMVAPLVANVHVKDFAFSRSEGAIGFTLAGVPLGTGLLDYEHMLRYVRPVEKGISQIVEHWLPWQGTEEATLATELAWSRHSLAVMRQA